MRSWCYDIWHNCSNQLFYQKNYIYWTRSESNALWYWIALESIVLSNDCIRCIIHFRISSRYTICSKLVRLFETIECRFASWCWHDTISIWLFESIVSSERLHLSCYWLLDTFSLHDLIWICCTTCSWLDYICNCSSMSMCSNWCKNSRCLFLTKFFLFF